MKKIISLILSVLMLASLTVPAAAVDDAAVNYVLGIRASDPADGTSYAIGETVEITVYVTDILGTETPPIYGLNGVLNYNSSLMELDAASFAEPFGNMACKDSPAVNKVSFSFLCGAKRGELAGEDVAAEFEIGTFSFIAVRDGIAKISLDDFIITNKDATPRLISSDDAGADIKIGTGVMVSDAETLGDLIAEAEADLDAAVIDGITENLVYPAFTVSRDAYKAFEDAIKAAKSSLESAKNSDEFLAAEKRLQKARTIFEAAKIYGAKPGAGGNSGSTGGSGNIFFPGQILPNLPLITVTAQAGSHGRIADGYESQNVRYATSVTIISVPDAGYTVDQIKVNGAVFPGKEVFTIPSVTNKTIVEVSFKRLPSFTDVAEDAWYFEAVETITEMGLFKGTGDTEFSPNNSMTRAMLVTVLHRLDKTPAAKKTAAFADVQADTWYSEAVAWASENGIVNGYSAEKFGTNDSITRQDMVTILYRYLKYKGLEISDGSDISGFSDAASVSGYALGAMQWAYGAGLINGTGNNQLSPLNKTTRAQVAVVLYRYTQNISAD